eukprot:TRINITY_DN3500_c0_g1_i3.p1 TRINITY_DN3500_c0_g1~~TRINITY_DN3500_c0_g1_i3.p1  ORF type:complete len:246 (-),score=73.56 TRINITY_DN3500_c0_g1_i3:290-1027(-)
MHRLIPIPRCLEDKQWRLMQGRKPLVLLACGSFSPITNMHLRIFEDARNAIDFDHDEFQVIGGYVSPVHDGYKKDGLATSTHRVNMCKLAVEDSNWIDVSSWEVAQDSWTQTVFVLEHFETALNENYRGVLIRKFEESGLAIPEKDDFTMHIHVKLLGGADLLDSFRFENVWTKAERDVVLGKFGMACIERDGVNINALLETDPLISPHRERVVVASPACANTISSSSIRYEIVTPTTFGQITLP